MRTHASARASATMLSISLMLAIAACSQGGSGAGAAGYGAMAPQVTVVTLKSAAVTLTRELPGRTSAFLVAEVRPQVSGIIKQRLFTEGGTVKVGQPLYELDDAPYRAAYNSAQAALKKAQATREAARLAADRSAELIKIDAVSKQDNDNAVAASAQAEADVAAEASVASSGVNLGYAHITAPISGRIGKSSVTQGALVTANQAGAMATVTQLDPIYVDVNQSSSDWLAFKQEIDSGRLQSGKADTPAKIILSNGSSYAHDGTLQFADVTVDPTTGNFLIRAIVPNPEGLLMPGMYVRAVVNEGVRPDGLLVPQQGVTRDPKGAATALVVDKDNKVEQRMVVVNRTVGDQWLVDDGLAAGDRVIVEGLQKVKPGAPAQAVELGAAPPAGSAPVAAAPAAAAK